VQLSAHQQLNPKITQSLIAKKFAKFDNTGSLTDMDNLELDKKFICGFKLKIPRLIRINCEHADLNCLCHKYGEFCSLKVQLKE
jgi:hypothetical protein